MSVTNSVWAVDNESGKVFRLDFVTGEKTEILAGFTDLYDIIVDAVNEYAYFTHAGGLSRVQLDGTGHSLLQAANGVVRGVSLDLVNNHVFWADDDEIRRCNLDGSSPTVIGGSLTGLTDVRFLEVDAANDWIFVAVDGELIRTDTDGSNFLQITTGDVLGVTLSDTYVFYSIASTRRLYRAELDGSNITLLHTTDFVLAVPTGLVFDSVNDHVWWSEPDLDGTRRIRRLSQDGTSLDTMYLLDDDESAYGIALDGSPASLPTTTVAPTTTSPPLHPSAQYLTWSDSDLRAIRRVNYDGSGLNSPLFDAIPAQDVTGVVVHGYNGHLYWTSAWYRCVFRSNLDGTDVQVIVDTGLSSPSGLAIDTTNSKLFVADAVAGMVFEYDLDGDVGRLVKLGLGNVSDIACDPVAQKLYIVTNGVIKRLDYTGQHLTTVYSADYVLYLDLLRSAEELYFTSIDKISKVNFDGTGAVSLITGLTNVADIAVDDVAGEFVWSEPDGQRIRRADLDGTNIETLISDLDVGSEQPRFLFLLPGASDFFPTTTTTTTTTTTAPPTTTTPPTTTAPPTTTTTTTRPPDAVGVLNAREQIAVDQPPMSGSDYPFVGEPSDSLGQLIGDLFLFFRDSSCAAALPLRIRWISDFGTNYVANPTGRVHQYDMLIEDNNGDVVFDSREATSFKVVAWGSSKQVIEWATDDEVLRVVMFIAWENAEDVVVWDSYFEPTSAVLDPRALQRAPKGLQGLIVEDHDGGETAIPVGENIVFRNGYNTEFELSSVGGGDGQLTTHVITVHSSSGSGLGRYPGCIEEDFLTAINKVQPDDRGNIIVQMTDCGRLELPHTDGGLNEFNVPLAQVDAYKLMLFDDCGQCCNCQDFINVYEAIRRQFRRLHDLGRRAEAVRDLFRANKARWEANSICRAGAAIRIAMASVKDCRVAIAVGLCNNTDEPLKNVELTIDLSATPVSGCLICESVFRQGNSDPSSNIPPARTTPYKLEGESPTFRAYFDCIDPGALGKIIFVMEYSGEDGDTISVTGSVTAGNSGGATPVTETTSLRCSPPSEAACCQEDDAIPTTTTTPPPGTTTTAPPVAGAVSTITRDILNGGININMPWSVVDHTLQVGDQITISGTSRAAYNTTHTITSINHSLSVRIGGATWVGDSSGGNWVKL